MKAREAANSSHAPKKRDRRRACFRLGYEEKKGVAELGYANPKHDFGGGYRKVKPRENGGRFRHP